MSDKREPEPHWLNQTQMAKKHGVSRQLFQDWNIKPAAKIGRNTYYEPQAVDEQKLDELKKYWVEKLNHERYRLTKARAEAQEMENQRQRGELLHSGLMVHLIQKTLSEVAGVCDRLPMTIHRQCPDLKPRHIEIIREEIIKMQNAIAEGSDNIDEWIEDYEKETSS